MGGRPGLVGDESPVCGQGRFRDAREAFTAMSESDTRVRIDKWLWAARFYKTRSLAADALDAGKAKLNGERVKPAKLLKPGDVLSIRNGQLSWEITVLALSERRGSAMVASMLYSESDDSRMQRERQSGRLNALQTRSPADAPRNGRAGRSSGSYANKSEIMFSFLQYRPCISHIRSF